MNGIYDTHVAKPYPFVADRPAHDRMLNRLSRPGRSAINSANAETSKADHDESRTRPGSQAMILLRCHLMPCTELPEDFRGKHPSVRVAMHGAQRATVRACLSPAFLGAE